MNISRSRREDLVMQNVAKWSYSLVSLDTKIIETLGPIIMTKDLTVQEKLPLPLAIALRQHHSATSRSR